MTFEEMRLASPTGADIALYHAPAGTASGVPARGILLISHGLSEHARRYARFAKAMAAQGLHVYAHDHRGHGATNALEGMLGRFAPRNGIAAVLDDVAAVRDAARARHPGLPVILFGHSMGGLIALNAASTHPQRYDALAIWNANFRQGLAGRFGQGVLSIERALKGSDVPSMLLTRFSFDAWGRAIDGRRTMFDWLSHDPAEVDAYVADPLCGFPATVSLWSDLLRMSFDGASPGRLARLARTLPVHLVGGSEDPATHGGQDVLWLARQMKKTGLRDVTATVYPGARHETLNDTIRETSTADFAAWCNRVTSGREASKQ